jgi:hypothetical protein
MPVTVMLRIFSGRPNPRWELSPEQIAQLGGMVERLDRAAAPQGYRLGGLGYHGFEVQPVGEARVAMKDWFAVYGGAVVSRVTDFDLNDSGRRLERWLLDSYPDLDRRIKEQALREFDTIYRDPPCGPEPVPTGVLGGRPRYTPAFWNSSASALLHNNCYNYSTERRHLTGDSATPGAGGKHPVVFGSCSDFSDAVLADGNTALRSVPNGPLEGWPIALFTAESGDNHFYRQDDSGNWSHKPGAFPARSCDESGALIEDPTTADTLHYTFCGFFLTGRFATIK